MCALAAVTDAPWEEQALTTSPHVAEQSVQVPDVGGGGGGGGPQATINFGALRRAASDRFRDQKTVLVHNLWRSGFGSTEAMRSLEFQGSRRPHSTVAKK